jgi:hypothetical protein
LGAGKRRSLRKRKRGEEELRFYRGESLRVRVRAAAGLGGAGVRNGNGETKDKAVRGPEAEAAQTARMAAQAPGTRDVG